MQLTVTFYIFYVNRKMLENKAFLCYNLKKLLQKHIFHLHRKGGNYGTALYGF